MNYSEIEKILIELPLDTPKLIYSNNGYTLSVLRPSVLTKDFEEYDVNTNIQIWLQIGVKKPFKPNHFRLLLDLYNRVKEIPESKNDLFLTFDKIFYGEDPIVAMQPLTKYSYTCEINPLDISVVLAQLFITEQNVGFAKKSNYNPRSLYIQGWIRAFIDGSYEIDQVISGLCHNRPPKVGYTKEDDKNHKQYNPNANPLWYTLAETSQEQEVFLK